MGKKTIIDKELPGQHIKINDKDYEVIRLTKKGLFQLARLVGKLQAVVDLTKLFDVIRDQTAEEAGLYILERLLIGLPYCEDEFTTLLTYILKDSNGIPPTQEQIDNLDYDTLEQIIKAFISQQDIGDLVKRFFSLMTETITLIK